MPRIWKDAVRKIKESSPGVNPYAVATASLQKAGDLKAGTRTATKKGIKRGKMTEAERHARPARRKREFGGGLSPGMQTQYADTMDMGQSQALAAQMAADARKDGGPVEGQVKRPHLGRAGRRTKRADGGTAQQQQRDRNFQ